MNGKEIKVAELELKFGQKPRLVNVFGVFRYKPNNGLYVIYADVDTIYDYVCYGASHIKNNSVLSMNSNKAEDVEVIKEYIFKIINNEPLDNFEVFPLDNVDEIEIISSKNFEIKKEVLASLIDKTIPKKLDQIDSNNNVDNNVKKKKSPVVLILFLFLLIVLGGAGYLFLNSNNESEKVSKIIYCKKDYSHEELEKVTVEEEKTFKFNNYDKLDKVDITTRFNFSDENIYLDFINKSLYFNYMPDDNDDTVGSYKIDNDNNSFITYATVTVDQSYQDPVDYEEVLSVSVKNKYDCDEKIEK